MSYFFGTSVEFELNLKSLYELRKTDKNVWKAIKVLTTLNEVRKLTHQAFAPQLSRFQRNALLISGLMNSSFYEARAAHDANQGSFIELTKSTRLEPIVPLLPDRRALRQEP